MTLPQKTLLIVYHSLTGGTEQMARAAADGAGSASGVRVNLSRARETAPAAVLEADGYLFATPENLASMAGLMKDFFDRQLLPGARASERSTLRDLDLRRQRWPFGRRADRRIATGWRLRQIAPPLIVCTHAQTPEAILKPKRIGADELAACRELGATLAEGIAMGVF